jgi:hypothetical protein
MKHLIFVFASMEATPMIMLYRATFELTTLMAIDRLVGWFMVLNATHAACWWFSPPVSSTILVTCGISVVISGFLQQ